MEIVHWSWTVLLFLKYCISQNFHKVLYRLIILSELFVHKVTFQMDKTFNRTHDEDGGKRKEHWQHHCTTISPSSFQCDTKHSKWNLNTKFIFNDSSVVEHKRNKDKNVETRKTYQRISSMPNFDFLKLKDGMTDDDKLEDIMLKTMESEIDAWE